MRDWPWRQLTNFPMYAIQSAGILRVVVLHKLERISWQGRKIDMPFKKIHGRRLFIKLWL
ncbi:hypothetical protein BTM36_19405 [Herbaspirillum sp. VT-16-41]|nr:hypothetical protein BTM36_19405 [Herbaspirillum sp. VT-16-41]